MERKGLLIKALALAALLAISHNAQAGARVGHRGWDRVRRGWTPGIWVARRPGLVRGDAWWRHRHEDRAYREGYWHSR